MNIGNQYIAVPGLIVPDQLRSLITVRSNAVLTPIEVSTFNAALEALACDFSSEHFIRTQPLNIIFVSGSCSVTFEQDNPGVCANHLQFAVYYLDRIRAVNKDNPGSLLPIAMEELCHAFYACSDERTVCQIVQRLAAKYVDGIYYSHPLYNFPLKFLLDDPIDWQTGR